MASRRRTPRAGGGSTNNTSSPSLARSMNDSSAGVGLALLGENYAVGSPRRKAALKENRNRAFTSRQIANEEARLYLGKGVMTNSVENFESFLRSSSSSQRGERRGTTAAAVKAYVQGAALEAKDEGTRRQQQQGNQIGRSQSARGSARGGSRGGNNNSSSSNNNNSFYADGMGQRPQASTSSRVESERRATPRAEG
jgi:hypothetical protein